MSEWYETEEERAGQELARATLEQLLIHMPVGRVEVHCTPQARHLSHDLEIFFSGMFVGVAEVKTRSYSTAWFRENGWALPVDRFRKLKKQFWLQGHGWTKDLSMILVTSDKDVFLFPIEIITENWESLEKPPPGWAKAWHGEGPKPQDEDGIVLPLSLGMELTKCKL